MLDLLFIIPCEKAILAEDETVSAITIMEAVGIDVEENTPPKLLLPMKWHVITLWRRNQDIPKPIKFEQLVEVIAANGDRVIRHQVEFVVSQDFLNFRNMTDFLGFPITTEGDCLVELSLRKKGQKKWQKYKTFPIATLKNFVEGGEDVSNKNDAIKKISTSKV